MAILVRSQGGWRKIDTKGQKVSVDTKSGTISVGGSVVGRTGVGSRGSGKAQAAPVIKLQPGEYVEQVKLPSGRIKSVGIRTAAGALVKTPDELRKARITETIARQEVIRQDVEKVMKEAETRAPSQPSLSQITERDRILKLTGGYIPGSKEAAAYMRGEISKAQQGYVTPLTGTPLGNIQDRKVVESVQRYVQEQEKRAAMSIIEGFKYDVSTSVSNLKRDLKGKSISQSTKIIASQLASYPASVVKGYGKLLTTLGTGVRTSGQLARQYRTFDFKTLYKTISAAKEFKNKGTISQKNMLTQSEASLLKSQIVKFNQAAEKGKVNYEKLFKDKDFQNFIELVAITGAGVGIGAGLSGAYIIGARTIGTTATKIGLGAVGAVATANLARVYAREAAEKGLITTGVKALIELGAFGIGSKQGSKLVSKYVSKAELRADAMKQIRKLPKSKQKIAIKYLDKGINRISSIKPQVKTKITYVKHGTLHLSPKNQRWMAIDLNKLPSKLIKGLNSKSFVTRAKTVNLIFKNHPQAIVKIFSSKGQMLRYMARTSKATKTKDVFDTIKKLRRDSRRFDKSLTRGERLKLEKERVRLRKEAAIEKKLEAGKMIKAERTDFVKIGKQKTWQYTDSKTGKIMRFRSRKDWLRAIKQNELFKRVEITGINSQVPKIRQKAIDRVLSKSLKTKILKKEAEAVKTLLNKIKKTKLGKKGQAQLLQTIQKQKKAIVKKKIKLKRRFQKVEQNAIQILKTITKAKAKSIPKLDVFVQLSNAIIGLSLLKGILDGISLMRTPAIQLKGDVASAIREIQISEQASDRITDAAQLFSTTTLVSQVNRQSNTQIIQQILLPIASAVLIPRLFMQFQETKGEPSSTPKKYTFGWGSLLERDFSYISDMVSILYGIKATKKEALAFLRPGRVFTGIERRKLI